MDGTDGGRKQVPMDGGPKDAAGETQRQLLPAVMKARLAQRREGILVRDIVVTQDDAEAPLLHTLDLTALCLRDAWMPHGARILQGCSHEPVI